MGNKVSVKNVRIEQVFQLAGLAAWLAPLSAEPHSSGFESPVTAGASTTWRELLTAGSAPLQAKGWSLPTFVLYILNPLFIRSKRCTALEGFL